MSGSSFCNTHPEPNINYCISRSNTRDLIICMHFITTRLDLNRHFKMIIPSFQMKSDMSVKWYWFGDSGCCSEATDKTRMDAIAY